MSGWLSFRQIDTAQGWTKGEAFRRFKQLAPQWREDIDYRVLQHEDDHLEIAALREHGLIYESTVNLVLLSPPLAAAIAAFKPGA